jgi:hypothetical protein
MQVSEKAAIDVGGGNRFDIGQNRAIGRAYLGLLYHRYGNWMDAVSAYNWGMGNLDRWISRGRQSERLVPTVAVYLQRILRDSGMCSRKLSGANRRVDQRDHLRERTVSAQNNLFLPGLEQSGHPLPRLVIAASHLPGTETVGPF